MSQVSASSALDNYSSAASLTGGSGNADLDKDAFLKLLITQFQYQDPLNPMDDKEFIAQLAQFSSLEQTMAMNESMQQLTVATAQQTTINITNYIGLEVSARGLDVSKSEDGISTIQYAASEEMASCYVNILDSQGQIVDTVELGAKATGIHEFVWDGQRNNGSDAPEGTYTAVFSGKTGSGETALIDTSISGRVTGTVFYLGQHFLRMDDGRTVLLSDVREVVESKPKVETPAEIIEGTKDDDYIGEKEGIHIINAGAGNDIIVYDAEDELVDGGEGYDFLIASGDVGENAKNYEAIIRGADAQSITSMKDLEGMGLVFTADGDEIDTTAASWTTNWKDAGKNQWTYAGLDKKITLELMTQTAVEPDTDTDTETDTPSGASTKTAGRNTPAPQAAPQTAQQIVQEAASQVRSQVQARTNGFSEALSDGMKNVVDKASESLSSNTSSKIDRFMKAMTG